MNLSQFIKENAELIAEEWIKYAFEFLEPAKEMTRLEVKDHIMEMLKQISADMLTRQTPAEQTLKSKGQKETKLDAAQPARDHGAQRLDANFNIVDLSSEFRALRASVLRLWEEEANTGTADGKQTEIARFNEAVDEAWMHSMAYYHNKMDKSKNWFLGILGHDLRSPLQSVQGVMGILALSENLDEEEKDLVKRSESSIQRMKELIDNLLEMTHLRLGSGIYIRKTTCDLVLQCEKIQQEFRIIYPGANIRLQSPGPVQGQWDSGRIEQVISNLVANALRYGTPGGPVTVNVSAEGKDVILAVHNEGDPIPDSRKELIFEGMYRVHDQNKSKKESSYGIGLYVVNEIIKAHNGKIEVESDAKTGTTFKATFPRQ